MSRISYIGLSLCIAFITPASSAESGSLIRLTDREDLFGWEAVGRIDVAKSGYCTGVLIANDLVLTAAHCVFSPKTGQLYAPEKFTFRAGLRDGKPLKH